jgi:uncharacterized membrane protein YfcA
VLGIGTVHLTAGWQLLLVAAGLGAGIMNGIAGGGTLLTFPVLLAAGYPALTANQVSTVGNWTGYIGGLAGFRAEMTGQGEHLVELSPVTVLGAIVGSVLLLTTPSHDFSNIAPWLVLAASVLFAVQPALARALGSHEQAKTRRALLFTGTFLTAVYAGYFGAGMGVLLLAVLGSTLPDTLKRTSGLRMALSVLANGIAAVVFMIHGTLAWGAVGLLAVGNLVGGWCGARVARRLPSIWLRALVVMIGLSTGIKLLVS